MHPLARPFLLALLPLLLAWQDPPQVAPDPAQPVAEDSAARARADETVQEARTLFARAKESRQHEDREEAQAHASQAVDRIVGIAPGSLSPAGARLLLELARFLGELGDLRTARTAGERAVDELARVLPPDHPDLTFAQGRLAITLSMMGDQPAARALFERVLEACERTLPADHRDVASARMNLATTLAEQGDMGAARALLERALEVMERTLPPDDRDLAVARMNLSNILFEQGDLSAARALEERVLAERERELPDDHPDLASSRANLAVTLFTQGDLPGARALLERVLAVWERTLPEDHPDRLRAQLNLAGVLLMQSELPAESALQERARELQQRVIEVRERTLPADHPDILMARANLAVTLQHMGELSAARALQEEVLEARERARPVDPRELAAAQLDLGATLAAQEDLPAARALLESVLRFRERTLPADHPDLAKVRRNLAQVLAALLFRTGADDRDEASRLQAELTARALDFVRGLRRMTSAALLDGSPREVEERLWSQETWIAHTIALARGYGLVAMDPELTAEAFLMCESNRAGGPIAARLAARAGHDGFGLERRAKIAGITQELARLAQSGASAEDLARAHAALDFAGRDLAQHARDLLGSAAPLEPTLELLTRGLGPADALVSWRKTRLLGAQRGDPITWTEPEVLIAFVLRPPDRPAAGQTTAPRPRLELVVLGPLAAIEAAIDRWRRLLGEPLDRGIERPDHAAEQRDAGRNVRALVLDPLLGALQGADHVVVALDDALHAIPLDALPAPELPGQAGEPGRLLGDVLRIDVRSSLIERLLDQTALTGRSTLLAIGHPSFDADPAVAETVESGTIPAAATRSAAESGLLRGGLWERGFGTLPETRAEVRGIAQYFEDAFGEAGQAVVLERRRASRDALVELAPTARWLHVATHAWFAPDSVRASTDREPVAAGSSRGIRLDASESVRGMSPMLLCGLALAGANLPVNAVGRIPGLVTAQEIAALDLSNCELAVLSACDTNVGLRRTGQGVASLQKALNMAGARSVITSLWKVPDEATKDLMIDFYRRVWIEKKPKHQALWEAKTKLRNARDERGDPRYTTRDWAAWVLTGSRD